MIDVIHSYPTWLPKTQTWMHALVQGLPSESVRSHVVCERTDNLDQFPVRSLHCLRTQSPVVFFANRVARRFGCESWTHSALPRKIKELKARIVHSHFGTTGAVDCNRLAGLSAAHVVTFYGTDVTQLPARKPGLLDDYQVMFSTVARVLCEGNHMAKCVAALGCPQDRIVVQHLGVDVTKFEYRPRSWVPNSPLRVLIAASFREKKGIPYAIEAIGRLQANQPVELTIIGDSGTSADSINEKRKIQAAAETTGLIDEIRWLGYVSHADMIREAYRHHVFLSPSVTASDGDTEGGAPVSLIEMAATGMPVVSTFHCDIPEVILDGETGWLAEERSIDSLVDALESMLAVSNQWPRILKAGRDHIAENYCVKKQCHKLGQIYQSII